MKKSFLSCVAILMAFVFNVSVVAQTAPTLEKLTGDEEIFHFYLSQGVAVDKNPASPHYGYTYVTAATDGASDGGSDRADTQKRGIFVFDAELNSLNPDNVGFLPANAAALMTDVSRQAMHRLAVNPVNNHVVFCYNVEGASAIWSMDPANLTGDAVNLIEGLAITKANAFCFDAEGTLYVMDNANTADGGKIVKVVNGELVTVAQNAIWGVQDLSLASDGRGGLWVAQNRWNVDVYAVLSHVNAAGEVDFAVTKDSPDEVKALFPQEANASYRGQCAYYVEKDVLAFGGNKVVALFQVTYDEAGVPSIEKLATTEAIGNNIDGVDFYANGDLAVVSASAERFVKYAVNYGEPAIEWIPMPLEITNLTTMEMPVEGVTYLQLTGRDDMNDADVMLFLNNYTGEEKAYEVNVESSLMTFGGLELTVMDGSITKSVDPEKGDVFAGTVHASVVDEEVGEMYVEFALTMYALAPIAIELEDVEIVVNEESAIAFFNATWEGSPLQVEVSGFENVDVKEYEECWLSIGDDVNWVDAAAGPAAIIIEDGVAMLEGEFTSFSTGKTYEVMLSGKLSSDEPENPEVELPAANVRAWAYDLALAVEGDQYTFSYKATTAAKATLILTDAEGAELDAVDLGLVEAGANTAVLAASELPAGQEVTWAVKLEAGAIAELAEVTDQSRGIYDFYNMMDVLVDNNPESEHFGNIYIQQSLNGSSDGATDRADTQIAGFFVYDQALNELNPTSNVGIQPVLPEGYTMGDARNKFHRLEIDPKTGNLTWCYNIAGQPAVFAVDPANLSGEAANLVAGIEGLSRTSAHCFDAEGALYVYDLPAAGSIFKIVDGVATEFVAPDSKWVQASATMAADGMGGLWVAQNRGQMDTYYQLAHYNAAGVLDYAVYNGNENGFSGSSTRGALAYDAERQLLAQGRNGMVEVYSVVYDAETGVPALTLVATTPSVGTNIDGLAFDYAGDLYVVNSSKEKFQKFAMPTDNNVCTTPAAAKYAFQIEGSDTPDQGLTLTATGLETTLESDGSYTLQGLAVVNGDESNLMDFMLCVYPTEGYTDAFLNNWSVTIWGAPTPGAFVENEDGTFTYKAQIEDNGTVYNIDMSGTIKKSEGPEYTELEDQITNLTFDAEANVLAGGPSENHAIQVSLKLGNDNGDGTFALSEESTVIIKEMPATFIEGYVYNLDTEAPSAVAVIKVDWDGMYYEFTLTMANGEITPDYMSFEDEITNLVIDLESMAIIGGPSTMWQVEVFLGLAEDDNMDGQWSLSPESSVAIMGFDARLIDGYVYDIDVNAPAAKAVLYVEDSGFFYEFKLNMTSTPTEAIVVVVEDATVQIDTIPLFGDAVDYALKMTADWTYAEDGVTYPVLVEVPVYYPEATEPSEMTCTVTIGGMGDTDPWLGFGEGTLTITTVDGVVTAKGLVSNPYTGVAFDVTVSGKLPQGSGTGIDNVQVEVKALKTIKNGQLIIVRDGKEFNAQGAVVK